jgi:homoaconitase/3-isopropylmalate dehydratase large subunit
MISAMSLSERFTLSCLSESAGRFTVMIPFDDSTARYLRKVVKTKFMPLTADPDAAYINEFELDISFLTPQVAFTWGKDGVFPIEEVSGKKIDQVVIGCCANGRIDDFEIAAKILRGRHISRDIRMMIIPGSRKILAEALDRGFLRSFIDSGCMIMNPGCGSCIEAHRVYLEPGERAISTAGCALTGAHGLGGSETMIASPATAAASALEGAVADPRKYIR